jgi:hypothetical protein
VLKYELEQFINQMEKKALNYSPRDLIIINGELDNES